MLNVEFFPVFLLPIARFDEPVSCTTHTGYFCRIVLYCVVIVAGIAGNERLYPDSIYLRDDDDDLNRITIASEKMIKEFLCPKAYSRLGKSSHTNSNDILSHPFFNGFNWKSLRGKTMNAPFKPSISSKYDGHNFVEKISTNEEAEQHEHEKGTETKVLGQDFKVNKENMPKWVQAFMAAGRST